MKEFNLKEFNKDGNKFICFTFSFDSENGLKIEEEERTVSVRRGVTTADMCDFNCNSGSTSSKNFFEVSDFKEPAYYFFTPRYNYKTSGFLYSLPENKDLCLSNLRSYLKFWLKQEIEKDIKKAEKTLAFVQY